jgi:hypothetical protein
LKLQSLRKNKTQPDNKRTSEPRIHGDLNNSHRMHIVVTTIRNYGAYPSA